LQNARSRIWVHRFQTHLLIRISLYFFLYQVAVAAIFVIGCDIFQAYQDVLNQTTPAYCVAVGAGILLFVGLLFISDAVKFTHRIVGPLYRFRQAFRAIAAGEEVPVLKLRKGDYLHDLKAEFNAMLEALKQRGAVVVKAPDPAVGQADPRSVMEPRTESSSDHLDTQGTTVRA
jgi:nitrogen fixation/metabolism regulation signal transduction histidine kinase